VSVPEVADREGRASGVAIALRAVAETPDDAELRVALADQLFVTGQYSAAAAHYARAVAIRPRHPRAAEALQTAERARQTPEHPTVAAFAQALEARRTETLSQAEATLERGGAAASFPHWQAAVLADPGCMQLLDRRITEAMTANDLEAAGRLAWINAGLSSGSAWFPDGGDRALPILPQRGSALALSLPKLRHDAEQFRRLRACGVLGPEFAALITHYEEIAERLAPIGREGREALGEAERAAIGHVFNRIVHIRPTPRVRQALSDAWDRGEAEARYLAEAPGVVVIDDFLSAEALAELRAFCLESTVWNVDHYRNGRLGAFFRLGFNCPLLLQIAEELGRALPRLIGERYPLRQLWGFKYEPTLPDDTTHADFAAVNVNFWITPDEANRDPESGGLIVYRTLAPLAWDFDRYNRRADLIQAFLGEADAQALEIPYRQNRAVIFNSNLFHRTAKLDFRPGYEDRRINVTMLYGDREDALHRG
jgi:hypothetical protein